MKVLLFGLILILVSAPWNFARGQSRPNVLFMLADQWRGQALGYAGDSNVKTPNLDRLEAESADFVNAVSSLPVCSPTRASLLTGLRATTHGIFINDAPLASDRVTFAKVLRAAGYDTGIVGKWHVNGVGRLSFIPRERRQGFDYWKVMECTHDYNHSFYYGDEPGKLEWKGYDAIAQTDDVCNYIRGRNSSSKPFVMCLWWGPPHNPYETAPAKYKAMYSPQKIKLRANVPEAEAPQARKDLAGYYAHCSAVDDCVGRLWSALKDAGLEENTIIVFSSDHGDMLWSHGFNRKEQPWDESVRVPMLWHWPAGLGRSGRKLDAVMGSEDVMPTMLGLCSVKSPTEVEGLDYASYMRGGGENPNRGNATLIECVQPFSEWSRAMGGREFRGLRTSRFTYVRSLKGPWLLYDNEKDPYQMENLAGKGLDAERMLDDLLTQKLHEAKDDFQPGDFYLKKWGYHVGASGSLSTAP